jgi:hypothetical protein
MIEENVKFETVCSQSDIAAYLDGELDSAAEMHLEMHLAQCENCFNSLKEQKMVLCALNAVLDNKTQIELPVNFAKKVTVRAESGLSGLRRSEERWMAVTLCALLFGLIAAAGLAGETSGLVELFSGSFRIVYAAGGVIGFFLYNIGLGAVIFIRTVTRIFLSETELSLFGLLLIVIVSLVLTSTFLLRFRRFKF